MHFDELVVADVAHVADVRAHFPQASSTEPNQGPRREMATNGAQAFFGDGAALLTVAEVASSMRVSSMTVYRLIKSGDLAAVRVGHNYRVRRDEIERYLTSRSVQVEGS
jgi:excisionase family DNA binding protein